MHISCSADLLVANIQKTTYNTKEKSKKNKLRYSGWNDGPYNTAKGEQALWCAVITQAMIDATSNQRKPEAIHQKMDATRWLTGNSPDFIEVCERAGLPPDYVRKRAKKALTNPGAWRTDAGQSARYTERKELRAYKKKIRNMVAPPTPLAPMLLQGPWESEVCHAE
jgi:hypothetical protein